MAMIFSLNATPQNTSTTAAAGQSYQFWLKEQMVAAGWVVKYSFIGSGSYSATDQWTSYSTIAAWSWIILESPAGIITGGSGKVWIVIHSNATVGTAPGIKASTVLPTGYSSIPGTIPSATNELAVNAVGTALIGASVIKFNFVAWSNGCFWSGVSVSGLGYLSTFVAVYPISDINYSYPYAIGFKAAYLITRWSDAIFDAAKCWNYDGTASSGGMRARLMTGIAGATGTGLGATGDLQGNHLSSNVYMFNDTAASNQLVGKLGAETYDFGVTGCTALTNGTQDGNTIKRILYGGCWLPANAVITS